MSYAEVMQDDDVFSWDYWKLDPELAAVNESHRPGLEYVYISNGDPTLKQAAARMERLMDEVSRPDIVFQNGDEFIPNDHQVGTVISYEREFLATCGHPSQLAVHAQLHENSVVKKSILGVKFMAPSYWNDPEPGMHWAYRHDRESGWGIVLPTEAGPKAVFGLKLDPSSMMRSNSRTGDFGTSFGNHGDHQSGLSYEALRLPMHDRCPVGTSTMITKHTRPEGDPSRAILYRVERVNNLRVWLPARQLG